VKVLGVDVQPKVEKEPLLDVPAIVMTDATQEASGPPDMTDAAPAKPKARNTRASKATSQQGRSKNRRRPAAKAATASPPERQAAKAAAQEASTKRTRDGSVGRETFAAVEALVRQGKTKSEAFKQIAEDTGKNSGTVAAAYYRVARSNGTVKPRQRRVKVAVAARTRPQKSGSQNVSRSRRASTRNSVDQIVGELVASVQALTEAVMIQDAEVRELRSRVDGVRSLIDN
jgi:hypothetical protein